MAGPEVLYIVKDAEALRRLAKKPAVGRAPPGAQASSIGVNGELEAGASSTGGGGSAERQNFTRQTRRLNPSDEAAASLCRQFQPFLRFWSSSR